jgi:hypothetical protein
MKTPIRYQSRLLIRRSYKPERRLSVVFRPQDRFELALSVSTKVPIRHTGSAPSDTVPRWSTIEALRSG